jgi:hypothetical protein
MHPLTSPPPVFWDTQTLSQLKTEAGMAVRGQPGSSWTGWEKVCITAGQLWLLKLVVKLRSLPRRDPQ